MSDSVLQDDMRDHESDPEHSEISEFDPYVKFYRGVQEVRRSPFELPSTVSLLECPNGTKVYLIGTAHFSKESIEDVKFVMTKTLPDVLVVELCDARRSAAFMTEEQIERSVKENTLVTMIKSMGITNGIAEYLLLRASCYIMKQVGMAPGGEFRAAVQCIFRQPHFHLLLGDRPIHITLQRALDSLSVWMKVKFFFSLLFGFSEITPEDIEAMKKEDLLEQLLKSLTSEYPDLTRTLLEERDLYLTRSIWEVCGLSPEEEDVKENAKELTQDEIEAEEGEKTSEVRQRSRKEEKNGKVATGSEAVKEVAQSMHLRKYIRSSVMGERCCPMWPPVNILPRVVVAVVGMGHVAGIKRAWLRAPYISKEELCKVKPKTRSWFLFRWTTRILLFASLSFTAYYIVYGTYRLSRYLALGSS
nr:traB domain containing protein [Hymenolepis microstoma]